MKLPSMRDEVFRWSLFQVGISLIPLALNWLLLVGDVNASEDNTKATPAQTQATIAATTTITTVPTTATVVESTANEQDGQSLYAEIVSGGEPLLIAVALTAAGLGELSGRSFPQRKKRQMLSFFSCICIIVVASFWFALLRSGTEYGQSLVVWGTTALLVASILAGGSCVDLAAGSTMLGGGTSPGAGVASGGATRQGG